MADVRTSHTATPMRGWAAWDPERHRAMSVLGGLARAATGGFGKMPRQKHLSLASKGGRIRGRQLALPSGVCPKRLLPALRALGTYACVIEARTRLTEFEMSGEVAGALEARGFATTRIIGGAETVHITALGRRAIKGAT